MTKIRNFHEILSAFLHAILSTIYDIDRFEDEDEAQKERKNKKIFN
jgi:hypothetical protein